MYTTIILKNIRSDDTVCVVMIDMNSNTSTKCRQQHFVFKHNLAVYQISDPPYSYKKICTDRTSDRTCRSSYSPTQLICSYVGFKIWSRHPRATICIPLIHLFHKSPGINRELWYLWLHTV